MARMLNSRMGLLARSLALIMTIPSVLAMTQSGNGYARLVAVFDGFLTLDTPAVRAGAPDYTTSAIDHRRAGLKALQTRLAAIDSKSWTIDQQVDRALVEAELNAADFELRVLRPWARDPAFYKSVWTEQS